MKKDKSIIFSDKSKKGTDVIIRYPKMSDLKELCKYINKLSQEKTYITYQGEKISAKEEGAWLKKNLDKAKKKQGVNLSIFIGPKMIGICGVNLGRKIKSHVGGIGLSIDKDYRGEGLGELIMRETIKEAEKKITGLKMMTLEVFEENKKAHNLYKKLGFKEYGHLPKGLTYKGKLVGEILMYKEV